MANIADEMDLRKRKWSVKETMDLLNFCHKHNIGKLMSEQKCNKRQIYQEVFNEMVRLGYEKTLEQIIVKFKNLSQKYRKGLPKNSTVQINKKRLEMWSLMHEVFKYGTFGRPLKPEKDKETTNPIVINNTKNEPNVIDVTDDPTKDPLGPDDGDPTKRREEAKSLKQRIEQGAFKLKKEVDDTQESGNLKYFTNRPISKADRGTANYLRCVRYLVEKFRSAQEELQNKFYIQQLKLQQQQQEWEERILDEEREFFLKILKQSEAGSAKKRSSEIPASQIPSTEIKTEDDLEG